MIAHEKRQLAAELLLQFYKGTITNDQMTDYWPSDERDRGLMAVYWGVWGLYDDLHEHLADPEVRRSYRASKHVHRCLTFLRSQCEYEWRSLAPMGPGMDGINVFQQILIRLWRRIRGIHVAPTADEEAWPFSHRLDYYRSWRSLPTI